MWLKIILTTHVLFLINSQEISNDEDNSGETLNQVAVNGEDYNDENKKNVSILHFPTNTGNVGNIDLILNFPNLEELYIENYNLTKIPIFANLPKLVKISLLKNQLEVVTNASFSTSNLREIYLTRNKISQIYDRSFGPKTIQLFLTCNELIEISSKWFVVPKRLQLLNVGGNQIRTLRKDTFKDFTNLNHLDLRLNQLKTLETNSLSGPVNLSYLYLSYNNLTEISGSVFGSTSEKVHMTYFEMKYNWLSYITDDFLNKLKIDNFKIWANPWQCACKRKIKNWWTENNSNNTKDLAFEYDTPCITPLSFADTCVASKEEYIYEEFRKIFNPIPLRICGKSDR